MGAASGLNESAKTFTEILGPTWGKVCEEYGNGRLVWAHDGINIAGWVELAAAGVLLTISFRNGVWELSSCDDTMVDTTFGTRRHMCVLSKGGKFVVKGSTPIRRERSAAATR